MSEEFQKWISSNNFQIFDKLNDISNKDNNDSYTLNDGLLTPSDITVYYSKQSVIDLVLESKLNKSLSSNANKVFKWFNEIKVRKQFLQKFEHLLSKSTKVFEFLEIVLSNTPLKVSRNRVQSLLKTLNYAINNQIFNYSNETQFRNIEYSVIKLCEKKSFLLNLINQLIGCLVSGIPVVLIADGNIAISASYLLDLFEKAGLETGIVQLVITDHKNMEKLNESTKPTIAPIFVVFESADIESGIDRIANSYINDTIDSIHVFVQQSVYKKFCDRMKTRLTNSFEIGDRFEAKVDILSKIAVNYEAIDFDNNSKSFGIQIFKFRTNDEMKNLIQHFIDIPFISLWSEKTSLALEFAGIVDSSHDIYINNSMKYPIKSEISITDKVLDKTELNLLSGNQNKLFESMLSSNKKWKTTPEEERERILKNFCINYENKVPINRSTLESSNQKITETKDNNGIQLMVTHFESIGLVLIKIEDNFNERSFGLVFEALVSGNSVLINSAKPIEQLVELKEYLLSMNANIFDIIDIKDNEVIGNTILTFGGKPVGLYLQELKNISRKSFLRSKKSITLSFGDISYAK